MLCCNGTRSGSIGGIVLLVLSIAFLFIAPLIDLLCLKKDYVFSSINGFVFVVLATLISIDIIPELFEVAGITVLLFILLGLLVPYVSEKAFHQTHIVHNAVLLLGILGLAIHVLADGAVLALHEHEHSLVFGVAIHRIPIGLFVWWFVKPNFNTATAYFMLAVIALGTLIGHEFAGPVASVMQFSELTYFQAFVVGSLIHVLIHKSPVTVTCSSRRKLNQRAEGLGNLLGVLCVFYLLQHATSNTQAPSWFADISNAFYDLALETAPMLLLAIVLAGLIKAFMPDSFVNWLKTGKTWQQANKGMIVGIPIPLCSCSVIPFYHSLIKKGVPPSAAVAFLIATPELGIDALLISIPLLGAELTVTRLLCAALLAITVAIIVAKYSGNTVMEKAASGLNEETHKQSVGEKLRYGMHYSFHELLDHIAPWILVGVAIAAIMQPFIGQLHLESIPSVMQVLLFALIGIPVYVCASSATPIVAILLAGGVSPGAGLAFLLAGPATNITTFGVLSHLHGRATAFVLALSCLVAAIILGIMVNLLLADIQVAEQLQVSHEHGWIHLAALFMLVLLYSYTILRTGLRSFFLQLIPHQHGPDHTSCSHHH